MVTFTLAYHGPNAENLGGVKNDYWQFDKVDDVLDYFSPVAQMVCINALSAMISLTLLWESCNINLLKESNDVISRYGRLAIFFVSLLFIKVR